MLTVNSENKKSMERKSRYMIDGRQIELLALRLKIVMSSNFDGIISETGGKDISEATDILTRYKYHLAGKTEVDISVLSEEEIRLIKNMISGIRGELDKIEAELAGFQQFDEMYNQQHRQFNFGDETAGNTDVAAIIEKMDQDIGIELNDNEQTEPLQVSGVGESAFEIINRMSN